MRTRFIWITQIFFNKISKNTEMFDKAKSIFVVLLPPDFIHF